MYLLSDELGRPDRQLFTFFVNELNDYIDGAECLITGAPEGHVYCENNVLLSIVVQ
jgi:hypothetical protein